MKKILLLKTIILCFTISNQAQINDLPVDAMQDTICSGSNTIITTIGSQVGIDYYLRNSNGTTLDGPIAGTGGNLSFNTGALSSTEIFSIIGNSSTVVGGTVLDFDGIDDRLLTPYVLPSSNQFTIEAWIYPRGNDFGRIVSSYRGFTSFLDGEFLFDNASPTLNNGRALRFIISSGNTVTTLYANNVLTLNAWQHVAVSFNNGIIKLFLNGVEIANGTAPTSTIPGSTSNMCIGGDRLANSLGTFDGKIDEGRIWTVTRTATEIMTNKNNCLTSSETGLSAYFKLDDLGSGYANEEVAGKNGVLVNMDPATDWLANSGLQCLGSHSFQMTQTALITVIGLNNNIALINDTLISLQNDAIYQWIDCDNGNALLINGNNQSYSPRGSGNYAVIISDPVSGCVDTSACFSFNILGLEQYPMHRQEWSVFPNPVQSELNVKVSDLTRIAVIDVLERELVHQEIQNTTTIDISSFDNGIYFIKNLNTNQIIKFIKN